MTLEPPFVPMAMTRSLPLKNVTLRYRDPIEDRRHCHASIAVICVILGRSVSVSRVFIVDYASKRPRLGCKPNRPESVFYSELPGTRRYTANSFFIMYSEFIGTNLQKTRSARTRPELHVKYRGPISDNGT